MSMKEWFRTHFVKQSFEYVTHQIESIHLRGDDKILAIGEKYRLQLELCNYFTQQLECLSREVLINNPILSAEYVRESCFIIEKLKKPITEYLLVLETQNYNNPIVQSYVVRNSISTDMTGLARQYKKSAYKEDFIHNVKLIDNYINNCKDKNKY